MPPKVSKVEEGFVAGGVTANVRVDGRHAIEQRPFQVETGVLDASSGSARVLLGATEVLVSVSAEIGEPDERTPRLGRVEVAVSSAPPVAGRMDTTVQTQQRASRSYNDLVALELARVLNAAPPDDSPFGAVKEIEPPDLGDDDDDDDDGDEEMDGAPAPAGIDYRQLFIKEGRCWVLYIDVVVLEHDGNVVGAASIAIRAALLTTMLPKVTIMPGVSGDEGIEISNNAADVAPLPGGKDGVPVAVTLAKIAGCLIADPTRVEEACAHTAVVVGVTPRREVSSISTSVRTGPGDPSRYSLHPSELQVALRQGEAVARQLFHNIDEQLEHQDDEEMGGGA